MAAYTSAKVAADSYRSSQYSTPPGRASAAGWRRVRPMVGRSATAARSPVGIRDASAGPRPQTSTLAGTAGRVIGGLGRLDVELAARLVDGAVTRVDLDLGLF